MPNWNTEIRARLLTLHLTPTHENAIVEELAQHLDELYESLLASGASPAEAYHQTLTELRDRRLLTRELQHLERRQTPDTIELGANPRSNMIADLWQDIRYSGRALRKHSGLTAVIALSLTLGIAANTTIFSAINALLLAPPPVDRPDDLWQIWRDNPQSNSPLKRYGVTTYPSLQFLREHQQSFQEFGAMNVEPTPVTWNRDGEGVGVQCQTVSGNYFALCGVPPARGRMFAVEEDLIPGMHPVTVLSYEFWQNRLGAEASVIGKTMVVNGISLTVIGVAPPGFTGAIGVVAPEMWIPYAIAPTLFRAPDLLTTHTMHSSVGLGRLKPGITTAQAEAELNALMRRLAETQPDHYKDLGIGLLPSLAVPMQARGMIAGFTSILMAGVFFVLLIACANAANLLLVRATARRAEMAMRAALGANRGRLLRQLLTESILLAGLSGIGGVLLTMWLTTLIVKLLPDSIPMRLTLTLDWRVLAFAAFVSLLTGFIFGLAPAWQSARVDLTEVLKSSGREVAARRSRLSRALVVVQMAICLILLIAAALCLRSLREAQAINPGFQIADRVVAQVNLQDYGYTASQAQTFYAQWIERVAAQPGVRSVAIANYLPLGTVSNGMVISAEGQPRRTDDDGLQVNTFIVSPGYFATMGSKLVQGREFSLGDRNGAPPVAIINETAASQLWPGVNPIGRRLILNATTGESLEVVGVVQNGKYRSLGEVPCPVVFMALGQQSDLRATLVAHISGDASAALSTLRRVTKALDARLALNQVTTLQQHLTLALFSVRTTALLLGILGSVALLLAASGLFGVMAYSVAQRTREVGIRLALGAQPRLVVWQIIGEGMRLAVWGIVLGLAGAAALSQLLQSVLFNVSTTDPLTFITIPLLLTVIALFACWLPARRAAHVNPMEALRSE